MDCAFGICALHRAEAKSAATVIAVSVFIYICYNEAKRGGHKGAVLRPMVKFSARPCGKVGIPCAVGVYFCTVGF